MEMILYFIGYIITRYIITSIIRLTNKHNQKILKIRLNVWDKYTNIDVIILSVISALMLLLSLFNKINSAAVGGIFMGIMIEFYVLNYNIAIKKVYELSEKDLKTIEKECELDGDKAKDKILTNLRETALKESPIKIKLMYSLIMIAIIYGGYNFVNYILSYRF